MTKSNVMDEFLFNLYRILVPKPLRTILLKKSLNRLILEYFEDLPAK